MSHCGNFSEQHFCKVATFLLFRSREREKRVLPLARSERISCSWLFSWTLLARNLRSTRSAMTTGVVILNDDDDDAPRSLLFWWSIGCASPARTNQDKQQSAKDGLGFARAKQLASHVIETVARKIFNFAIFCAFTKLSFLLTCRGFTNMYRPFRLSRNN